MSKDEGARRCERRMGAATLAARPDTMERVHRVFDERNVRHAVELILASPDAEKIVRELAWRLAQRGRTSA